MAFFPIRGGTEWYESRSPVERAFTGSMAERKTYSDVPQQSDELPRRPRYLEFSWGLLVGSLSGHEFDSKGEFHFILANMKKAPFVCIYSPLLKPSQLFILPRSLSVNVFWTRCTETVCSVCLVNWYVSWSSETSLRHDRCFTEVVWVMC